MATGRVRRALLQRCLKRLKLLHKSKLLWVLFNRRMLQRAVVWRKSLVKTETKRKPHKQNQQLGKKRELRIVGFSFLFFFFMCRTEGFSLLLVLSKTELGGSSWTEMYAKSWSAKHTWSCTFSKSLNNYYENIEMGMAVNILNGLMGVISLFTKPSL